MKNQLWKVLTVILFCIPNKNSAQTPDLGTASDFGLFTKVGALENTGVSCVTGNVGTDAGASNFTPAIVTGEVQLENDTTAQAALDVEALYTNMVAMSCGAALGTTLGNDQVLTPNTYCVGAAATIEGDLFLDAQGDRNAVFVFKINGAFAPAALSNVILINKASMCNVYWQVNGAFATGDHSVFRGNIVVNGAIALYNGTYLAGRAFSKVGSISLFSSSVISLVTQPVVTIMVGDTTASEVILTATIENALGPFSYLWSPGGQTDSFITVSGSLSDTYQVAVTAMNGCSDAMDSYFFHANTLPIELISFISECDNKKIVLKWTSASEINNDYYSISRSMDNESWEILGKIEGAGNSSVITNYSFTDNAPCADIAYYLLKQMDIDGNFKCFDVLPVKTCREDLTELRIYPNPVNSILNLSFDGDIERVHSLSMYNSLGKPIYNSPCYQSSIDISVQPEGIYFLQLILDSKIIIKKIVIE